MAITGIAYYQKLLRSRKFSQLKPIEKDQYEYFSNWYHPAVRELVVAKDFDATPEWISRRLFSNISPIQVQKSIELIEKLGFIEKTGEKSWKQSSSLVSTGPELASHVVHNYHKIILDLTKEILDRVPPERRDVSTMTLGIAREQLPELKRKVQEFREEVLKLVSTDVHPEEVVQLNIQLIPLTKSAEEIQGARL